MGGARTATLQIDGQTLLLLPERAVFLPASDTLVVADAQIGMAAQPANHLGVPVATVEATLAVLSGLLRRLEARRVVFLGDFLHAAHALDDATLRTLTRWRELHGAVEMTLVLDDDGSRAVAPPAFLDVQSFDAPLLHRGLAFVHQPRPVAGAYVLAGHLHPCVSVGGSNHDWQRVPCFWIGARVGVLPAFGVFTGMQSVRARRGERIFAATDERVLELMPKPRARPT